MTAARATNLILAVLLVGSWTWFATRPDPAARRTGATPTRPTPKPVLKADPAADETDAIGIPAQVDWSASPNNLVTDTGSYAQRLLTMGDGEFADELVRLRAQQLGRTGFKSDAATAAGLPDREDPMMKLLLARWGQVDPRSAIDTIAMLDDATLTPAERAKYTDQILEGWITSSPLEAWAWARESAAGLNDEEKRQAAGTRMVAMVAALVEAGRPDVAAALMRELPANDPWSTYAQANLFRPLAVSWSRTDPSSAIAWATRLPNGTGRNNAISGIAQYAASEGPDVATQFMNSLTREADIRNAAGGIIAAFGERGDTAGAFAWLQSTTGRGNAGGQLDIGIRNYFQQKALTPIEGMQEDERALIAMITNPGMRNTAANQYVARRQNTMPQDAIQAVVQFYEPARQEAGLANIVRLWAARDYQAAAQYVNSSGLIPDVLRPGLLSTAEQAKKK